MTPEVCVVGRTDFHTGIGAITAAACELLARRYRVTLHTPRNSEGTGSIRLPSGREIPVVTDTGNAAVTFFADVLWNGVRDGSFLSVPTTGFRVAHMAWDSDRLPPEWVDILNTRFDLALFSSDYLIDVARKSGVRIPAGTLPIGLPIEELLARRYRQPSAIRPVRFGTLSAYHRRKNLDLLVEAFELAFRGDTSVELQLHSNLAIGEVHQRVAAAASRATTSITLTHGDISDAERDTFLEELDVYVNVSSGEGYSIGPRQALALGKRLVLSDLPAHRDMLGMAGTFAVPIAGSMPAAYPEIDDRVFGRQALLTVDDIARTLVLARDGIDVESRDDVRRRRRRASEFSNTVLATDYMQVVEPEVRTTKPTAPGSRYTLLPLEAAGPARAASGRYGSVLGTRSVVVPAHDGGFFSLFNAYLSHLVWGEQDSDVGLIVPDWRPAELIRRRRETIESFCYGRPEDGNAWTGLFEPPFGLTSEDLDDPALLDERWHPTHPFNERREPSLTFVNAHDLYLSPEFGRIRRTYHSAIRRHIRLRPEYSAEVAELKTRLNRSGFVVGVHVKHPSHGVEQPGGRMADRYEYVARVHRELERRGHLEDDWAVFLATDQERVRNLFRDEFGDRLVGFDDVMRIGSAEDEKYDALPEGQKLAVGFQLQHIVARNPSLWSTRLAWEVWRDAEALAMSDVLIHAVSNVATAAAFLNPDNELRYFEG